MSLMKSLIKVAAGVMLAKGIGRMMNNQQGGRSARGQGGALLDKLLGKNTGAGAGSSLSHMLGRALGSGSGGGSGGGGSFGGLLDKLGG